MWWSSRALLLAALVSACGFSPALSPRRDALGGIAVTAPETEAEYAFVERLEERLPPGPAPAYTLRYEVDLENEPVRVTRDEIAVRYNVVGAVTWALTRDEAVLRSGRTTSFTSYEAGAATVSERTASLAARERLMTILADRIVAELLATATEWRR